MMTQPHPSHSNRIEYIDILRVFTCFLVILSHSTQATVHPEYAVIMAFISFCGSASSELFFSLSGAVLLPVKTDMRSFYTRRFLKLMPPLVFWSIVILVLHVINGLRSTSNALEALLFVPFKPVTGVYWFVYVMIGLYLFAPFISEWLKKATKRQIEFFLLLWVVNLLLPYLNLFYSDYYGTKTDYQWELHYFAGFLGYWLIGHYLRYYPIPIGFNWKFVTLIVCSLAYPLVIYICNKYKGLGTYNIFNDNLQAGSAVLVMLFYTIAQNIHIRSHWLRAAITDVAKCSFGIYLIHIIVVRDIVWRLLPNVIDHPLPNTLLISVISMALCYAIIKLISYLPYSKYIVGT